MSDDEVSIDDDVASIEDEGEVFGARVVVVGVAGRGGLRWWRGTRVVVVRCVLAETAVGRPKRKVEKKHRSLIQPCG